MMESNLARSGMGGASGPAVGWIGAGKMGAPMARHLLAVGTNLTVTEPVAEARAAMLKAGATVTADLSAQAGCDIVFATLPHDKALRGVVHGHSGQPGLASLMSPGSVFVEMSTVSPDCSAEVALALAEAGIRYVRAPVSGSTATAEQAALTILASGDESGWQAALPLLKAFSTKQFFLGSKEEARYMKLVINTLVGANAALLAEALSLGASGGLGQAAMMEVICESAVAMPLFKYKSGMIASGDYSPAFTVQQMMKDFTLISDAGRVNGVPLMASSLVLELYRAAANAGLEQEDFFALIKWHSGISAQ